MTNKNRCVVYFRSIFLRVLMQDSR